MRQPSQIAIVALLAACVGLLAGGCRRNGEREARIALRPASSSFPDDVAPKDQPAPPFPADAEWTWPATPETRSERFEIHRVPQVPRVSVREAEPVAATPATAVAAGHVAGHVDAAGGATQ